MNLSYPLKHWLTTLLVGPILIIVYDLIVSLRLMVDGLGLLMVFIAVGLVLSLPIFLVYLWAFKLLTKKKISDLMIKATLDIGGVLAIIVTFLFIIKGNLAITLSVAYSIALVLSSLFFGIDREKIELEDTID